MIYRTFQFEIVLVISNNQWFLSWKLLEVFDLLLHLRSLFILQIVVGIKPRHVLFFNLVSNALTVLLCLASYIQDHLSEYVRLRVYKGRLLLYLLKSGFPPIEKQYMNYLTLGILLKEFLHCFLDFSDRFIYSSGLYESVYWLIRIWTIIDYFIIGRVTTLIVIVTRLSIRIIIIYKMIITMVMRLTLLTWRFRENRVKPRNLSNA